MSHTKGPWVVSDQYSNENHYAIDTGLDGCILIERHVEGKDAEDKPNALLVAAAPSMLTALHEIADKLEGYLPDRFGAEYTLAMNAIAKAEGRE